MKKLNLSGIGQELSKTQMKKVVGGYIPEGCLYCVDWGVCFHWRSEGGEDCGGYGGGQYYEPTTSYWTYCNFDYTGCR